MADESICDLDGQQLSEQIREKALSPVAVVEAHLARIERLNGEYCAFITVAAEPALAAAKRAEAEIAADRYRGPLHGVPYAAKDIIDTAGILTSIGTARFFADNVPAENAECVRRLDSAGAILIGKSNTHEFAAGSTTINQYYGTARNPWNRERIVGGSSGGSAGALAARMVPLALGSDTGGSIRTPAAFCGIVGLKPTAGRISLRGIYPNVPTLDHAGPMARTVTDAAVALQAMAGYDPLDPKSQNVPVPDFTAGINEGVKGSRIAIAPGYTDNAEVDGEVADAFERAVAILQKLGAQVETIAFDGGDKLDNLFRRIAGPEFSEVHRPTFTADRDAYDSDVRERVEWSLKIPLDDYVRALRDREMFIRETARLMDGFAVMISPSVPCAAPPIATRMAEINGRQVPNRNLHRPFLTPHNLTGNPAISLPMGFNRLGLPLSIQVAGRPWCEADVLRVARALETATPDLADRRPPIG